VTTQPSSLSNSPVASQPAISRRTSNQLPELREADGSMVQSWKNLTSTHGHPVHTMMARLGSFPPALARYFILAYSTPGEIVCDPYCGKGTTLVEAIAADRRAIGIDVAPDAVVSTRAKISGATPRSIRQALAGLRASSPLTNADIEQVSPEVRLFYHPDTLAQLLVARNWLTSHAQYNSGAQFLLGCLLGIAHGKSSMCLSIRSAHAYAMAHNYVRKYAAEHSLVPPQRDVAECLEMKAKACLTEEGLPTGDARVYQSSAEKYTFKGHRNLGNTIDLIVTSPPYLNAQTYAKDAWLRLWLLGYDYRVVHSQYIETGSVLKYRQRMALCLREMLRILKPDGHAFLVAGDATARNKNGKYLVRTAEVLAEVASGLSLDGFGFEVVEIIDDYVVSHSRYLFPVHNNGRSPNTVEPKQERILHLVKAPVRQAVTISRQVISIVNSLA